MAEFQDADYWFVVDQLLQPSIRETVWHPALQISVF
jgi:hypothetical protein